MISKPNTQHLNFVEKSENHQHIRAFLLMQALLNYGSAPTKPDSKKREDRPDEGTALKADVEKKPKVSPPEVKLPGLDSDSDNDIETFAPSKHIKTGTSTKESAKFSKPKLMMPPQVRTGVPNIITEDREALFAKKTAAAPKK